MLFLLALILVGVFLTGNTSGEEEPIGEVMRDAVLHENAKVRLLGILPVNPALISAYTVTGIIFVFSLIVRIFVIPKFSNTPGRFQLLLEQAVGIFDGLAESNSPHRHKFLGAYVFTAGVYIFYCVILSGGIAGNRFKGVLNTLKDFSLPISMSFRLFGALLSGALVTELVYYYITTSFIIPIFVAVMFTMLHALIQAYVLTMLTALFYGEVSETTTTVN